MLPGPVPSRVDGEFRIEQGVMPHALASLADIESAKRGEAERRIWKAQAAYLSTKEAVRLSATKAQILDAVQEKQREMAQMIFWLSDPVPQLKLRASTSQRGERNIQFQSGISQLLEGKGYSLHSYKKATEEALRAVRACDHILTRLNAYIEGAAVNEVFSETSEAFLRFEFYRAIFRILESVEIKTALSYKSRIVTIILEVWNEVFDSLGAEFVRRKGLAAEVRQAVKRAKSD